MTGYVFFTVCRSFLSWKEEFTLFFQINNGFSALLRFMKVFMSRSAALKEGSAVRWAYMKTLGSSGFSVGSVMGV